MKLTLANWEAIQHACLYYHYARTVPAAGLGFNVYNNEGEWCGVILYGSGANPQIADPYDKWQGQVIELVRVALNGKQEKTSEALAKSLKMVKKYCPLVDLVVSFADLDHNHQGTIYQATNWIYEGIKTESKVDYIIKGKKVHSRTVGEKRIKAGFKGSTDEFVKTLDKNAKRYVGKGKHKYLYPMNKKMRKKVLELAQPYPEKGEC